MENKKQKAQGDFIRYANCWEDAQILMEGLRINPGDACLSIGSAGDTSLSMLVGDPALVVAVDFNPAQLACIELKVEAFRRLSYRDLLEFLGVLPSGARLWVFSTLKHWLSPRTREFWSNNPGLIEKGVIHAGRFENLSRIFRTCIVPLAHPKENVAALLSCRSMAEQQIFYHATWSTLRWDLLFRAFFSSFTVSLMSRDPGAFTQWEAGDVSGALRKRFDLFFSQGNAHDSPFLNYLFTGNYPLHALPLYLREENFGLIRDRLERLEIFNGDLKACLEQYEATKFHAFNLSDIFECMSPREHEETLGELARHAASGARMGFWNLLADRTIPDGVPVSYERELSSALTAKDGMPFHKRFVVGTTN